MTLNVGIYLFPDIEALDFAGPFEVFTTASRVSQRRFPAQALPFRVFSVAETVSPVRMRAGLQVLPDYALTTHPPVDLLLVPGGVIEAELHKPAVLQWVAQTAQHATGVASICTGAFILAQAGVLTGGTVTTHWEDQADLAARFPQLQVVNGPRWVAQGKLWTSAGIAAGIDMSLQLVSVYGDAQLAAATARQMDYPWSAT